MDEMDFDSQRFDSLVESANKATTPTKLLSTDILFGTLEIEGDGIYYCYLKQTRNSKTWILCDRRILDTVLPEGKTKKDLIVAVLKAKTTGHMLGYGKSYLLTRLMVNISAMMYECSTKSDIQQGFFMRGEYSGETTGSYIKFETTMNGRSYRRLELAYEGFILNIAVTTHPIPVGLPSLEPVMDRVTKAAVVTNLGVRTAASLFKSMGERLDWFKSKKYKLIDSDESFQQMMSAFLDYVQAAADDTKTVLIGLDTETTGLNMLDLAPNNPLRDNVVSIPFAWKDNEAYVICTDMFYFSNVTSSDVFDLFTLLFRRNPDFTFQDIELDYQGKHYSFNRKNITVAGWNVMFDEQAFFSEGADVFFDEDGRQIFFNLNTDLQQGQEGYAELGTYQISNSLKMQTRRMLGDETLELDELFGSGNEDKYRYLTDPVLANLYGGADADYTRLIVRLGIKMTEPNLYQQYRKYDMTMAYMLAKASWQGMPIDTAEVQKLGDLVWQDLERLKDFIYHYAWLANRETLKTKTSKLQELLGLDDEVEVESLLENDKLFRYPFTPANHKKLLFQMLHYPVLKRSDKDGQPALDKFVLQKLMGPQREHPAEILLEDVMAVSDPTMKLVDKDMFNRDAYPLARVFSTYATLNKEYTSYYKPIRENDTEGRMFYGFTLARAATRRILSPGQTMKGTLKKFVIAPPGKIFMSFDASQIEYRHMASLAYIRAKKKLQQEHPRDWERRLNETSIAQIHAMMQNEEADYHIETASSMTGVKQHEVTPKVRKQYKSIGFGIPYGLGERAMCESLHKGVVNDQTMRETKQLLADYKVKQKEIIDLLESTRDSAFFPANISEEHRRYLKVGDSHVGLVRNFVGFYRVFILENLTRKRTSRIRRQAGNCIIQGGAAELFRRMLYNFHIGCCRAGIQDKVQWLMTVHDELDAVIDNDIDIMCLIKVLYENCTLRYEDHIPYYIGINFGSNWYDAKADANELPVIMVQRMVQAYDAGKFSIPCDGKQAENLLLLKRHYMCDRVAEELAKIFPDLSAGFTWDEEKTALVDAQFENYVVRAYLDVFSKGGSSLLEKLQGWQEAREQYGFNVPFLATKFTTEEEGFDFSSVDFDLDLGLSLLDDGEEDVRDDGWFTEGSLFDQNASADDILVDSSNESYRLVFEAKEDEYMENDKPTSAFDVFVAKHYIRTKVLNAGEGIFSTIVNGTSYEGKERELAKEIRKHFSEGPATILIIGTSVIKVVGVASSEEDLNWLDKKIAQS